MVPTLNSPPTGITDLYYLPTTIVFYHVQTTRTFIIFFIDYHLFPFKITYYFVVIYMVYIVTDYLITTQITY